MGNSPTYAGNVALHAARARHAEQQAADYAAALKTLADAEAEADEAARVEAGAALVLPVTRRVKASPAANKEIS